MVMESGFSSPRRELFPAGLRVLVVDDDPTWLKILEKMLKKCSYEVTTCGLAREALKLLRDRKDGFDIVISDVNMPDMDGFKLLEHVGLEMDLPVIMMSVDGETSRVMKGVQHGACDYLLKPIRMKELKNIWQHVVRKRLHEVRDIECIEDISGIDHFNDGYYGGDQTLLKKRKDVDNKHDEKELSDSCSTKKARVVWTVELHQKFVKAVNHIGIDSDKIGPKKILDLMNVPWLTRENVASHLQKYRLYLSRIRKEDKTESFLGGMKNSDHSLKESSASFSLQNASSGQQNDVTSNFSCPGNQLPLQTVDSETHDTDLKNSNLLPLREHRKFSNNENYDRHKVSNSQVLTHSFGLQETIADYVSFESREFKPHREVPILQRHIRTDLLEPAPPMNPGPSMSESAKLGFIDIKPLNAKQSNHGPSIREDANSGLIDIKPLTSPVEREIESFSVSNPEAFGHGFDMPERSIHSFPLHSTTHLSFPKDLEPNFNSILDTENQSSSHRSIISQGSVVGFESEQRNPGFGLLGEDLMFYWLQGGDNSSKDIGFDYVGFSDFNFSDHVSDIPAPSYVQKFGIDNEYPFDWVDYPIVDQGLLFS